MLVETLVTEELHVGERAKRRVHLETDFMPRKTEWMFAQPPAADPGDGPYKGDKMNYPTWWLDPDYELDEHDESLHADLVGTALLLQLQYPLGPWQPIAPGSSFTFMTGFMTLFDSDEYERQSLSRRRVVRTLFPQVTEAPLYFYSTDASSVGVRHVADQAAELGFEVITVEAHPPSRTALGWLGRCVAADEVSWHTCSRSHVPCACSCCFPIKSLSAVPVPRRASCSPLARASTQVRPTRSTLHASATIRSTAAPKG